MVTIITLPAESLRGLSVQQGDTLRVLSSDDDQVVIEIQRSVKRDCGKSQGLKEWLRTANGSVRINPNESVDDVRREYYDGKYGIER